MLTPFKAADNSALLNNKEFLILLTPKIVTVRKMEILSGMFYPGSQVQIFFYPGYRMKGSKKLRIPDPHPQHC
jgi:hypothetical protein